MLQEWASTVAKRSMPNNDVHIWKAQKKLARSHLPHGEEPLGVQELELVLDELLEVADDEAALLLHPAVECHRLRIRP